MEEIKPFSNLPRWELSKHARLCESSLIRHAERWQGKGDGGVGGECGFRQCREEGGLLHWRAGGGLCWELMVRFSGALQADGCQSDSWKWPGWKYAHRGNQQMLQVIVSPHPATRDDCLYHLTSMEGLQSQARRRLGTRIEKTRQEGGGFRHGGEHGQCLLDGCQAAGSHPPPHLRG